MIARTHTHPELLEDCINEQRWREEVERRQKIVEAQVRVLKDTATLREARRGH